MKTLSNEHLLDRIEHYSAQLGRIAIGDFGIRSTKESVEDCLRQVRAEVLRRMEPQAIPFVENPGKTIAGICYLHGGYIGDGCHACKTIKDAHDRGICLMVRGTCVVCGEPE